jgi:hypothetical protein
MSASLSSCDQPEASGGTGLAGIGHHAGTQQRGRPDNLAGVDLVGTVQTFVLLILGIGSLILTGYAFIDVLRHKGTLFPHAGRLSKGVWLGILGAAFLIAILSFASPNTVGILNVAGVIAAGVYLADLRPKLRQLGGGRGSSNGPYGPY